MSLIHLTAGSTSVVLGLTRHTCSILHWGAALGELEESAFEVLADDGESYGEVDRSERPSLWREGARGFMGAPSIIGHRDGRDWSPLFRLTHHYRDGNAVALHFTDDTAGLTAQAEISLSEQGVLLLGLSLTNAGTDTYTLDSMTTWLPLPDRVGEILDFTGRWVKERQPQRQSINVGTWCREVREGRSGHDATVTQLVMTEGANFGSGEVWAQALLWSGNSAYRVERTSTGRTSMGGAELLLPGEIRLAPGETYAAPPVAAAYSDHGLDGITAAYNSWLRARPDHPTSVRPRPLTLNVWEAVWFDHDLGRLTALMDVAQEIGVERFVLDDGWFHLRRDDYAGLGDWWVDPAVWPDGLGELISRVKAHGMEFGLWFEPEMVNPDSDLYRAHPDWILHVGDRVPPEQRHQLVLDIANPEAWQYIFDAMNAILDEYEIAYIKWDHNRVLVEPGSADRPAAHAQTEAFYRLVDALKQAHPGLEIESCASGGGRIDLGAAMHCDRFWTSDCNEALERQGIQRWTGIAIPPELLGTHIGPTHAHSTGRTHSLSFRAVTALFGHAGIEWDLTLTTPEERAHLRAWADYYKANRDLLHSGRVVRADGIDAAALVHGVIAADGSRALFAYAQLDTAGASKPSHFTLPGLDAASRYRVRMVEPAGESVILDRRPMPEWAAGIEVTGSVLAHVGLRPPRVFPESAFLVEVTRLDADS